MEQNKKWGTINIINQLLRLYFQVHHQPLSSSHALLTVRDG